MTDTDHREILAEEFEKVGATVSKIGDRIWVNVFGLNGNDLFEAALAAMARVAPVVDDVIEEAAKMAEGEQYKGRYRTWPWWKPDQYGNRGNLDKDREIVKHCDDIAAAIRSLKGKAALSQPHDTAQRKMSDSDVAELDAALVKSTEHQYDIDRHDPAQGLYDALKEIVADSDDFDDGNLPGISAATLARARAAIAEHDRRRG